MTIIGENPAPATECATARPIQILKPGQNFPRSNGALAPRLVIAGWGYRCVDLANGRRQIVDFILPGDRVGGALASSRALERIDAVALTSVQLVSVDAHANLISDNQRLIDHIVRLGGQTACERVIDLMLELNDRLSRAGLSADGIFEFPVTQTLLGETLGMSAVHVNRTLQTLRKQELLAIGRGRVIFFDIESARRFCNWR